MRPVDDERGIALVLALFALVMIGALVGSTFLPGLVEQQSGRNTLFASQAREAAEMGLSETVAHLEADTLAALAVGGAPLSLDTIRLTSGLSASRDVSRLTTSLFLIRARGIRQSTEGAVLATCSLGALVRLLPGAPADTSSGQASNRVMLAERGWVQLY
jgi:hypothetical protein